MKNQLKTVLLLGALSVGLIALGGVLAPSYLFLFVVLALAMNLGAYFFSDRIVLRLSRARELPREEAPWLHAMVEELAARAEIPKPRVFSIPDDQPNAFATGRDPSRGVVAVTEGIVRLLDRRELRGVIAHEIAHIKNRDILLSTIAAALASIITYGAHAVGLSGLLGGNREGEGEGSGFSGLLFALLAPLGATLVQLGISRSREFLADETGAKLAADPEALASALLKLEAAAHVVPSEAAPATASLYIVSPFAGGGTILRWFSTHPPVEARVARLRRLISPRYFDQRPSWRRGTLAQGWGL